MMGQSNSLRGLDKYRLVSGEDFGAFGGVSLHDLPLVTIKPRWLEQNTVGYADFADVMHGACFEKQITEIIFAFHCGRHRSAEMTHPLDVQPSLIVSIFCRARQTVDDL